jgi:hypothetical protein
MGEAQATEVVSDEVKVPDTNGLTEGESTTRQALVVSGDDDCR